MELIWEGLVRAVGLMWSGDPEVRGITWLSLRHRGLMTITAANPGMPHGGFVGESKCEILRRLPASHVAPFLLVAPGETERLGRALVDFIGLAVGPEPLRLETAVGSAAGGAIVLGRLAPAGTPRPGRYTLAIEPASITINGEDLAGIFYGIQTLRQLLPPQRFVVRLIVVLLVPMP